jgi:hypothetical protein
MALLPGSPALDAGSNAAASAAGLTTDQRGQPRVSNGQVDIGAFEVLGQQPPPPVRLPPVLPVPERALVATLDGQVTLKPHHMFLPLFVRTSFADTGALQAEYRSPFQRPHYQIIGVFTFNADGDGVANTVVLIARRRIGIVTRTFRLIFTPADDGVGGDILGGEMDRRIRTLIVLV